MRPCSHIYGKLSITSRVRGTPDDLQVLDTVRNRALNMALEIKEELRASYANATNIRPAIYNGFNHLPDAVETTQEFHDFWYFWGDVQQRIYFDNWQLFHGISYPTNLIEERNGVIWRSTQALNVEFNIPIDDRTFAKDIDVAKRYLDP
jgi:hypothetical protein